ncbi:hypothetical protein [Enterococcus asini]|uniref:hypothetical protein n=1 Tax=Enterococcus asini TaxID=57732 RepID=UPI001E3456E6|nr:hypothetical protein [Enterococcus asini]MCD5028699.1 hypothetical protein [Enterococcus asini]
MKVSEAIDRLKVGDTVWVKATLDMINDKGRYVRVMPNASSVYLDGHDEISLAEPQAEKVEVTEEQAELLRAFKGESIYELLTNCLVEDEELMAKARLFGYTVKPKRWVVKFKDAETDFYFMGWSDIYKTDDNPFVPNGYMEKDKDRVFMFDDRAKAEAVATLVEGTVEEV